MNQGNVGDVSDPQQQAAATKIQSGVRGQQARNEAEQLRQDKEEAAAVTIQSGFRGYEARKRVQALKCVNLSCLLWFYELFSLS